ncbi:hypothetical protein, partial [Micromonospora okii]|uniref:hypothetical protein n=1 Tax=Micromonospora okii TaxID=1182970 RepID=UPI001E2A9E44
MTTDQSDEATAAAKPSVGGTGNETAADATTGSSSPGGKTPAPAGKPPTPAAEASDSAGKTPVPAAKASDSGGKTPDSGGTAPVSGGKGPDDIAGRKAGSGTPTDDEKGTDGKGTDDKGSDGKGTASRNGDEKSGNGAGGTPDLWEAFAPAPEPVPGRLRRVLRPVGRFCVHEWTLAVVASLALAVALTWPTLRYPLYTLPQDYWDPSLQAWQMAWSGHILLTEPAQLWHSNTFFPEPWSFAFSDTLLGYAPAGMIGTGPEAALLRYNIVFVLAHALATFGAYVLARQLGAGRAGAAVAGASYAYAPWLLAQAGHLHIISNGGIPLALAMLARGHGWSLRHGYRPERRRVGWVYAGWAVAAWQLSLGFGIGLPFAYVLAGATLVAAVTWFVRRRPARRPFGARLLVADAVGAVLFAGVGGLLAIPYFKVTELHPNAERTLADIGVYSPPFLGFFTAPAESRPWGGMHEAARATLPWSPEMTLLPGFALYALAAGGLFFSVWRVRHRLLLL